MTGNGIRSAILLALLGSTSPLLRAQDKLDRELDFVRALAERMRFIELAKSEADRLATEHRGAGDQDRIAQLAVQISFHGAKARSDRNVQRQLYKEALDKSKELIDRSTDEKVLLKARATLADAAQEFGHFLIEELELAREQSPDKVKELEEEAAGTFRTGIEACSKLMEAIEPQRKTNDEKYIEYGLYWMRKGVLMREQARAVKADRAVLIERAISELSEMVLDIGEETALGLRGLFEIAQCNEVGGNIADAIDSFRTTISQIAATLKEADQNGLPGEVQGLLFEMMQEVYVRLAEVLMRQGDPTTADLFTEFRTNMAEFGEKGVDLFEVVDPNWGHQMLLAEARFQAESGDAQKVASAIEMVQKINDKHPSDFTGIKAKAALRDILSVNQGLVSGKLLFEIAKGEFQNKNYEEAVKGLRRAIGKMTADEGRELGLEAWHMLGTAFAITDRHLEATVALTYGLQQYGKNDKDKAADPADYLDRAVAQLKRQNKGDSAFAPLIDSANEQILAYNVGGAGKIKYKEANDAFAAKDYAKAVASYREVPEDFVFYETAQIRIAKACVMAGDFASARQALDAYKAYREQKKLNPRTEAGKEQARATAILEGEFLAAQMSYIESRGNKDLKIEKDPTKSQDAITRLRAYVTNHLKDDSNNVPSGLEMLGRLHSDIGELDRAEECYAQLKPLNASKAAALATEIFVEYQSQAKNYDKELATAIAADNEQKQQEAQANLDRVRQKLGALGLDYIANSEKPQLAVLVNTAIAFQDLGDWVRVDEIAQKTLTLYGADTNDSVKKVIDLTVRPMIGEALLNQKKFNDAYTMLVAAEKANPTQWELKRQIARCLGGWFEINRSGQRVREPGLDRPAEAYEKYWLEYKTWGLREPDVKPYSLEWYRFHWECYWFCRQAAVKDSAFKERAETFYRKARATDDFETLKQYGAEGQKLLKYFQLNR